MRYTLRSRLTFANVVSVIALFVALGGSSYAAIKVTGKNVKDSSLTGKDVKNSSLTTSDVRNGSLLSRDFKSGQLPTGPSGLPGPRGEKGSTGEAGSARAFARVNANGTLDAANSKNVLGVTKAVNTVDCGGMCPPTVLPRIGAYCFKLAFTPLNVTASADAHNDEQGGTILATATLAPAVSDSDGCPSGFGAAKVAVRRASNGDYLDWDHFVAFN